MREWNRRSYYKTWCGILLICCMITGRIVYKNIDKKTVYKEAEHLKSKEVNLTDEIMEIKPRIAITFDDGPNASYTPILLDGLKKRGVHATFFLIGKNIEKKGNDVLVKRLQEEGHLIGNHTYSHVEIRKLDNETALHELEMTTKLIENITKEPVEYMRPPFGSWQEKLSEEINLLPVMWTVDPLDWTTKNEDEIVNKVVTEVKENDIILLHDCYESSVNAALRIVDLLLERGFEFVTVDELLID